VWGIWGLVFAAVSTMMPPLTVQVLSTIGLLPVAVAFLFSTNVWKGTNHRRGTLWGLATGVCGVGGTILLSQAFMMGGEASIVTPLSAMFPLITLLLAVLVLKERLNAVQAFGIGVALLAIYLFSSVDGPTTEEWTLARLVAPWMLSALAALFLFGIQGITQKLSTNDISPELGTICYGAIALVADVLIITTQEIDWTLPVEAWGLAIGSGLLMGVGIWFGLAAYRGGKASIVTALIALYPMLTVVLAVPILGETMTGLKLGTIALAILAGLTLTYERPTSSETAGAQPEVELIDA
jgi:drug/metabolite transporter (DMT)-like permease